ncbi:MAG: WD40/YVTN/BNR-like repeat-containing protein [Sphingobacteriaceae bacterium]
MTKQLLKILASILLTSCGISDNWVSISSQGLPQKDESYNDLIFEDSLTGYIGGNCMIPIGNLKNQSKFINQTVLYKTKDLGNSWLKIHLDYKGSVSKIFSFKDTLVVLLQDAISDSVYILKSNNIGENWQILYANQKNVFIKEIQFINSNNGFIITNDRDKSFLLKFHSDKWDTLLNLPSNLIHHKIIQNKLFSLITESNSANSLGVLITDIYTGEYKKLFFEKPCYITSITKDENNLYLSADHQNVGKIFLITSNEIKTYNLRNFSKNIPEKVFVNKNTIIAITCRHEDISILGGSHKILISHDNGKTWSLEELPNSLDPKPAFLYKDKFFITSGLQKNSFQIRHL